MPSINPISFATLSGNLRLAQMISMELGLLLRDSVSLRNTPYVEYCGSINGMGSNTIRKRLAGLGRTAMNPIAEGDTATAVGLDVETADVTVARQELAYAMTDLANMSQFGQDIDPIVIANSMAAAYDARFMELTVAAGTFTATKGSNSSAFSTDAFFEGIYSLERADSERGANGPFVAVLASKALTELQTDLRNESSNSISLMQPVADMLRARPQGMVGTLFGVDLYKTSHITDNGASGFDNLMWSAGALGYADGSVGQILGADGQVQAGPVTVEFVRDGLSATTTVLGHGYLGIAKIIDAKGVIIRSKLA